MTIWKIPIYLIYKLCKYDISGPFPPEIVHIQQQQQQPSAIVNFSNSTKVPWGGNKFKILIITKIYI
jgi:hypothetical protein